MSSALNFGQITAREISGKFFISFFGNGKNVYLSSSLNIESPLILMLVFRCEYHLKMSSIFCCFEAKKSNDHSNIGGKSEKLIRLLMKVPFDAY